jgi:hypothetical protein
MHSAMTAHTVHFHAAMHSILALHHLMHPVHRVALLHLTMHAHWTTRRHLCKSVRRGG